MGGWTPEAAEEVIGRSLFERNYPTSASQSDTPIMVNFESLVGRNLIQQLNISGETRFFMLETDPRFALERLVECREVDALRRRHAEFFLALTEKAKTEMAGPHRVGWVTKLEHDYENLRWR